jgi:phosphoserine phosphatase RsbU/P
MTAEPSRVLVVDDNEDNRDMLSRRLRRRGFDVALAVDGGQALELVERDRGFDVILLDVMMPGIDGLELLQRLRATRSVADLPIIMVTARDRSEDVVRALQLGANDYVTKPLDFPVVLARLHTQIALKRAKQALERAHTRMKNDLDAAARLQQALMPQSLPSAPGVRFAWRFRPCTELAGDILDIVALGDGRVGVYLVDVAGHGVPAALLSVTLSRVLSHMGDGNWLLRDAAGGGSPNVAVTPAAVAARLNARFPMDPATRQYFTFLYGILDAHSCEFTYVSAGHPGPVHLGPAVKPLILDSPGFAIGWFRDCEYVEARVTLQPGDRLYLVSDGILDAKSPLGELFDRPRLLEAAAGTQRMSLDESLGALIDTVIRWCGDTGPDDDISLIGVEMCPSTRSS